MDEAKPTNAPEQRLGSVATLSVVPSCPICGTPLTGKQTVCSPKCRIQRSMRRRAAKREAKQAARDAKVRMLLREALQLIEEEPHE